MNRLKEFLRELSELTQKYELEIGGCGCCGSPWVCDFECTFYKDGLSYDHEKQKYTVVDGDNE